MAPRRHGDGFHHLLRMAGGRDLHPVFQQPDASPVIGAVAQRRGAHLRQPASPGLDFLHCVAVAMPGQRKQHIVCTCDRGLQRVGEGVLAQRNVHRQHGRVVRVCRKLLLQPGELRAGKFTVSHRTLRMVQNQEEVGGLPHLAAKAVVSAIPEAVEGLPPTASGFLCHRRVRNRTGLTLGLPVAMNIVVPERQEDLQAGSAKSFPEALDLSVDRRARRAIEAVAINQITRVQNEGGRRFAAQPLQEPL
ncbi:MAG: hypothetical protein NTZ98_16905 [Acidobacteria bacterium]|nr:hypothetical protein [Acidobacteriota bacterium]